jgi:hypothetical protein
VEVAPAIDGGLPAKLRGPFGFLKERDDFARQVRCIIRSV